MSTLNLPYVRFTRQVSNGTARTKYSYQAMQQDLLSALKTAPWKKANCQPNSVTTVVNKVTQTDAERDDAGNITKQPSYSTFIDERFDAYKQGGDADSSTATFCGYAGMVAYRFDLPSGYSSNISQVDVPLQTSRYLRSGLRVCIVLSNTSTPSTDWSVIRGDNQNAIVSPHAAAETGYEGVSSWGVLNQTVPILLDSKPQEKTVSFKSSVYSALGTSTRYSYMWVYVSIEDYCDYWTMYSVTEPRYYSIEGSGTLTASMFSVTFVGNVTPTPVTWTTAVKSIWLDAWQFGGTNGYDKWDSGSASTSDSTATISAYINAHNEAYGNFMPLRSFESGLMLDRGNSGSNISHVSRLLRYANFQRKNAFSVAADGSSNNVPMSDLNMFAVYPSVLKMIPQGSGSGIKIFANDGGGLSNDIGASISSSTWTNTNAAYINDATHAISEVPATVNNPACLRFRSTGRFAQTGKEYYTRIKLNGHSSGVTTGNVRGQINVWRSDSADALGYFRLPIISALLSYQDLFVQNPKKVVTATVKGTGTITSDYTLSISAEYIGTMPFPSEGSDNDVFLDSPQRILPGDLLLFTPCVFSASSLINFDMTISIIDVFLA